MHRMSYSVSYSGAEYHTISLSLQRSFALPLGHISLQFTYIFRHFTLLAKLQYI